MNMQSFICYFTSAQILSVMFDEVSKSFKLKKIASMFL